MMVKLPVAPANSTRSAVMVVFSTMMRVPDVPKGAACPFSSAVTVSPFAAVSSKVPFPALVVTSIVRWFSAVNRPRWVAIPVQFPSRVRTGRRATVSFPYLEGADERHRVSGSGRLCRSFRPAGLSASAASAKLDTRRSLRSFRSVPFGNAPSCSSARRFVVRRTTRRTRASPAQCMLDVAKLLATIAGERAAHVRYEGDDGLGWGRRA